MQTPTKVLIKCVSHFPSTRALSLHSTPHRACGHNSFAQCYPHANPQQHPRANRNTHNAGVNGLPKCRSSRRVELENFQRPQVNKIVCTGINDSRCPNFCGQAKTWSSAACCKLCQGKGLATGRSLCSAWFGSLGWVGWCGSFSLWKRGVPSVSVCTHSTRPIRARTVGRLSRTQQPTQHHSRAGT